MDLQNLNSFKKAGLPAFFVYCLTIYNRVNATLKIKFIILILLLVGVVTVGQTQNQLILLKRGDVVARFSEGENIKCVMKDKSKIEGIAIRFNDFSIITLNDTIPFESIEKLYVKGKRKMNTLNKVGTVMMIAGVGYFVIDQINALIVEGHDGIDKNVVITSVSLASVGAALCFIKSPYQKLRGLSLRTIDPNSRYYKYD
jgi:hypothetical protein